MGNVFENVTRTTLRQARKRKRTSIAATAVAVVAAGLAGLSTTSTFAAAPPASGCAAVETIVVRGTGETPKAPYIGKQEVPLVSAISTGAAATVETYGLPYPASVTGTLVGGDYSQSQPVGRTDLQARIASQAAACPDQKFVLVGYSQGAWVVGDVLAGSGIAPLSATLGAKVAAVVLYGDPFFNAKESFNRGTFTAGVSSPNPRRTGALAAYASRIADFCNSTDQICQKGATGTGHDHYLDTYTAEAAKFVTALLPQPATPTPTATTAPVVTPTTAPVATPTAPVATATTAPVVTATAEPVVTATAEPVVTATAEPVVTATAEPVVTATAEPVVTATAAPVATIAPVTAATAAPVASTTAIPTTRITGTGSKCVDANAASTVKGAAVQLFTCNTTTTQQWNVASDGTIKTLGKCLSASGTADGAKVQLSDCNGTKAQKWTLNSARDLVNLNSGKCLTTSGGSSVSGTKLQTWKCLGYANQKWALAS